MKNAKYKLTKKSIEVCGVKLFQIQAIKEFDSVSKGDVGGYIEKSKNLSVYGNAKIKIGRYFGMLFKGQKIKKIKYKDGDVLLWKE